VVTPNQSSKPNRRAPLVGLLVLLAGAVLWFMFRPEPPPEPKPVAEAEPEPAVTPALTAAPSPPAPRIQAAIRAIFEAGKPERTPYDQSPGQPSHPTTPESERIQRENAMVQAMNDAMDLADGAKLRALVREHAEEYPEDSNQLRDGYDVVADCLEHPGPASRAAGERFFENERGSTLRRFVKRYCIEPRD
ncbi:MAG TPA: hypothetical protein VGL13_03140, partial [Polyangiaceae bacterium]|jgi:hypothetical protein